MALKTMPILFINLSGEMMYILDQRLRAQNITREKSTKVMYDIVKTMFNDQFIGELFKPQELYTKQAIRTVFEKLVHSSIMRLNDTSMDKLYDLMTMVFKYQLTLCPRPEDVLFVTLNHLDGIREFSKDSTEVLALVDNVYSLLIEHYADMTTDEFDCLRQSLLFFFEDLHIRVSVLLKTGCQRPDGQFILPVNGPLSYDSRTEDSVESSDDAASDGTNKPPPFAQASLEKCGDRGTKLGTNIYLEHEMSEKLAKCSIKRDSKDLELRIESTTSACEQLSFLSRLIGHSSISNQQSEFTLGVFDDEDNGYNMSNGQSLVTENNVVNINVPERLEENVLHKIMGDFSVEHKETEDQDLLELLDSA